MSEFDASDATWEPAELANVKGVLIYDDTPRPWWRRALDRLLRRPAACVWAAEVPMEVHVEDGILWATSGIVNIELPGTEEA